MLVEGEGNRMLVEGEGQTGCEWRGGATSL